MTTTVRCDKHQFEDAEGTCKTCHGPFCSDCLVYTEGIKKSPLCIPCALTAAGVRSTAAGRVRRRRGLLGGRAAMLAVVVLAAPALLRSH